MAARVANSFNAFFVSFLANLCLSGAHTSKDILVKDSLFTADEIRDMRSLLSHEETMWNFKPNRESSNLDQTDTDTQANIILANSCYSWNTNLSPDSFVDSSAWKKLTKTLSSNFGVNGDYRILAFEGQINIKGSHICSKQLSVNESDLNSFIAVIFLVQNWKRNGYGELVVYNDKGEILKAVHPKLGRLVIFPAVLEHVIKPPANDFSGRMYIMQFHILISGEEQKIKTSSRENAYKLEPSFELLTRADATPMERIDIKQFITRNFTTADGRCIVVLDNIFSIKELDALQHTVMSSGYNDNAAGIDSTDNVQWIMAFEVEEFVQTSMWQLVSQIVTAVSGTEGYYPYDIGCNNIQSADSTTIHRDCALDENEFTLLIYLNQNWTENHHGETAFFSDDESEVIFAVKPKYGRVSIFHGTIPHSARPPPFTFTGARLSFAVKMSPSKEIADKKSLSMEADIFYEALEVLQGAEAEKVKNIIQDLKDGKVDRYTLEKLVQEYEAKLH